MKNVLKLFGILDLISIGILLASIKLLKLDDGNFLLIKLLALLLGLSMVFSAYFLIRNKVAGLWIYYAQFIPRFFVSFGLSFGFLLLIANLLNMTIAPNGTLFIILYLLEAIRLIITIVIHRQLFAKTKNASI